MTRCTIQSTRTHAAVQRTAGEVNDPFPQCSQKKQRNDIERSNALLDSRKSAWAAKRLVDLAASCAPLEASQRAAVAAAAREQRAAPLRMPARLSPTAATAFRECQQLFLFRNMWKLPEPPSAVLVKGTLVHDTLEKMFELEPQAFSRRRRVCRDEVTRGKNRACLSARA